MLRLAGGCLGLILVVVLGLTVAANTVPIPWSVQYYGDLEGRTPAAFAAACNDLGAVLTEVASGDDHSSSCTTANGHSIRCDWDWFDQRCEVECEGSMTIVDLVHQGDDGSYRECNSLRMLAYVRPLPRATPAAAGDLSPAEAEAPRGV
jgi:hypothetical protein